ncbi:hypothetical protein [Amycolatopsis jiangsuensis]|uniref:Polymerase nucleotidyl transferase domain-containing protein n=1 Tax=Amycolatopsis jiangsuensis TaxID=1181879 RepID=A0A840IR09_9PSEU|nr:hypothetical protein [Amycolatopsis jiangsuensis]MBB4685001.1 hypothetical protein [Amycolatopsis jiangsuensis]
MTWSRAALAHATVTALAAACPGSRADLIGSLGAGTADEYSDIDVEWVVPDGRLTTAVTSARAVLDEVQPVAAVRVAPDYFHSARRRLLFVRFAEVSLFWRLDLAVREVSGPPAKGESDPGEHAGDHEWSRPASALANALGTIKAVARGRFDDAGGLVDRGFVRIAEADGATGRWVADVTRLCRAAVAREPDLATLAHETIALAEAELRGQPGAPKKR